MVTPQHILNERAQLKHISQLNEDVKRLQNALNDSHSKMERYREFHDYWQSILEACKQSDIVADQFCRFMVTVKLCIDEKIPGLTTPSPEQLQFDFYGCP